jgi:hypothetical protein
MATPPQQPNLPVVAFLTSATFEGLEDRLRVFREGLRETGFTDGRNVSNSCRKRLAVAANLPTPRLWATAGSLGHYNERVSFSFGHGAASSE